MTAFALVVAVAILAVFYLLLFKGLSYTARRVPRWAMSLIVAVLELAFMVAALLTRQGFWAGIDAMLAMYWFNDFWKNRPRGMRDKIAKAIGAKARALKEKLVAAMPKSSPVRIPALVPSGA